MQSKSNARYVKHTKHYIRGNINVRGTVICPYYSCPGIETGMQEFGLHLRHVHGIEM